VIAPNRDADGSQLPVAADVWTQLDGVDLYYGSTHKLKNLIKTYREARRAKPDVVYLNSLFNLRFSIIPLMLSRLNYWNGATILLAPRGELDLGALRIRRTKKRLFLYVFKLLRLPSNIIWHASAAMEAATIRETWGENTTVIVRENETDLPPMAQQPEVYDNGISAAFLGRIAPKKGLLLALQALRGTDANVELTIYGPEEDLEYVRKCKEAVKRLPSNVSVRFKGAVAPDEVRSTLAVHDFLLMPTSGENFGHVIAESLSVACPVICSNLTPWSELLHEGGGLVVDVATPEAWLHAIEEFVKASPAARLAQRRKAADAYEKWRQAPKGAHVFSHFPLQRPPHTARALRAK
jgi:glycosyltransferase involved in cell wall biosynthesis